MHPAGQCVIFCFDTLFEKYKRWESWSNHNREIYEGLSFQKDTHVEAEISIKYQDLFKAETKKAP